jgi:FMN phosphatase YigB (HAD superfamily)
MKTLLLKYQGVLLKAENEELNAFYQRLAEDAGTRDEKAARDSWQTSLRTLRNSETYMKDEEIVRSLITQMTGNDASSEEGQRLFQMYQTALMYGPMYRSAVQFLAMNTKPVYILTDAPVDYAAINLKRSNLHVNAVCSADQPRAHMCRKAFYTWLNNEIHSDCVFVTSEPEEAEAAAEAGMECFVMNHEGRAAKGNYHTIADLEDLALFLK